MAKSKKTEVKVAPPVDVKREASKRSNAEIAREVIAGKYGTENLERTIYRLGYNAKAVMLLVKSYGNNK